MFIEEKLEKVWYKILCFIQAKCHNAVHYVSFYNNITRHSEVLDAGPNSISANLGKMLRSNPAMPPTKAFTITKNGEL